MNFIKNNLTYIIWAILFLPSLSLINSAVQGIPWSRHNYHEIIEISGSASSYLILIVLYISPLMSIGYLKNAKVLRYLNQHKRGLGIYAFYYAFWHVGAYVLYENQNELLGDLSDISYLTGWIAFLIMIPLFLTSSNFAVKLLRGKKWKALHRLVYVSAITLALHIAFIEGLGEVILFYAPLFILEIRRYSLYKKQQLASLQS